MGANRGSNDGKNRTVREIAAKVGLTHDEYRHLHEEIRRAKVSELSSTDIANLARQTLKGRKR